MKFKLKINQFIFFGFCFLISVTYFTQVPDKEKLKNATPSERAVMLSNYMKTELNLNEKQNKQVLKINQKYAPIMDSLIKADDWKYTKYKNVTAFQAKREKEFSYILSASQLEKYNEIKNKMMATAR